MRRAARHGKLLGVNEPFLYKVVDTVVHENEGQYPDLKEKQSYITKVIRTEEENFARTIDGGIRIYNEMLASHKEKGETVFSGADAFKLYDTFGFPIDLTAEMAAEEGMTVDEDAFQSLMTQQKERAREARKALGDLGWAGVEFGKDMPATEFVGYDRDTVNGAKVLGIVAEGELVDEIVSGMEAILVLDKTPFYAEMGGQVADHGVITGDGMEFVVSDVQKNKGGKFMHYGKLLSGSVAVGDSVTASIDTDRRYPPGPQCHPSAGRGAGEGAGRPCASGWLSGGAGSPALRLHPLRGHYAQAAGRGGGYGQRRYSVRAAHYHRRTAHRRG